MPAHSPRPSEHSRENCQKAARLKHCLDGFVQHHKWFHSESLLDRSKSIKVCMRMRMRTHMSTHMRTHACVHVHVCDSRRS